jgi:hypothetical protein
MNGQFGVLNPFQKWKKGDLPCDPTVTVILNQCGMNEGITTISASLASDTEIDFAIDQLKRDLESARKVAKRILKDQREKIRLAIGE